MKNISLRFLFNKRKKASLEIKEPLYIEVRINRTCKSTLLNTGVKLYINQFSMKNGFTCKNHPRQVIITKQVKEMFNAVEDFANSDLCKTLADVKYWNKKEKLNQDSFLDFLETEIKKISPDVPSLRNKKVLLNRFKKFGKIISFSDLTYNNIIEFNDFLIKNGAVEYQTLRKRHQNLNYYIKEAIKRELFHGANPYNNFKLQKENAKPPVFLEIEELKLIEKYKPNYSYLEKVRDLFLFQANTGLAYVDLCLFKKDDISEIDGYKVLRSKRSKTNESFVSLLLPLAEKIAEKYNYELPKISNAKYNEYLKTLASDVGIKKNVTTHVARHSFATMLINKGLSVESVSMAMGHSNIKQTQHYAKLLGKTVISEMAKLLKDKDDI